MVEFPSKTDLGVLPHELAGDLPITYISFYGASCDWGTPLVGISFKPEDKEYFELVRRELGKALVRNPHANLRLASIAENEKLSILFVKPYRSDPDNPVPLGSTAFYDSTSKLIKDTNFRLGLRQLRKLPEAILDETVPTDYTTLFL